MQLDDVVDLTSRFGAVLEEFEVRDALESAFVEKLPAEDNAYFNSQNSSGGSA